MDSKGGTREGIAGVNIWCLSWGVVGCAGEGERVRCGEEGNGGVEALVSCSPNSQLLSAEQVHKASLEGFGEGRQDETQPLMVNRSVPLDAPLPSLSLPFVYTPPSLFSIFWPGQETWQGSMLLIAIFPDQKCHLPLCSPSSAS